MLTGAILAGGSAVVALRRTSASVNRRQWKKTLITSHEFDALDNETRDVILGSVSAAEGFQTLPDSTPRFLFSIPQPSVCMSRVKIIIVPVMLDDFNSQAGTWYRTIHVTADVRLNNGTDIPFSMSYLSFDCFKTLIAKFSMDQTFVLLQQLRRRLKRQNCLPKTTAWVKGTIDETFMFRFSASCLFLSKTDMGSPSLKSKVAPDWYKFSVGVWDRLNEVTGGGFSALPSPHRSTIFAVAKENRQSYAKLMALLVGQGRVFLIPFGKIIGKIPTHGPTMNRHSTRIGSLVPVMFGLSTPPANLEEVEEAPLELWIETRENRFLYLPMDADDVMWMANQQSGTPDVSLAETRRSPLKVYRAYQRITEWRTIHLLTDVIRTPTGRTLVSLGLKYPHGLRLHQVDIVIIVVHSSELDTAQMRQGSLRSLPLVRVTHIRASQHEAGEEETEGTILEDEETSPGSRCKYLSGEGTQTETDHDDLGIGDATEEMVSDSDPELDPELVIWPFEFCDDEGTVNVNKRKGSSRLEAATHQLCLEFQARSIALEQGTIEQVPDEKLNSFFRYNSTCFPQGIEQGERPWETSDVLETLTRQRQVLERLVEVGSPVVDITTKKCFLKLDCVEAYEVLLVRPSVEWITQRLQVEGLVIKATIGVSTKAPSTHALFIWVLQRKGERPKLISVEIQMVRYSPLELKERKKRWMSSGCGDSNNTKSPQKSYFGMWGGWQASAPNDYRIGFKSPDTKEEEWLRLEV